MTDKEMTRAKRHLCEVYQYMKSSLQSNTLLQDVPFCMDSGFSMETGAFEPPIIPDDVFTLADQANEGNDQALTAWLALFDCNTFAAFERTFREQEHPIKRNAITDAGHLFEMLADLQANTQEQPTDTGKSDLQITTFARGVEAGNNNVSEFCKFVAKGRDNAKVAGEILQEISSMTTNAQIAHYLYKRTESKDINRNIEVKTLWNWLKEHGYNVRSYQAFHAAFN